MAGARAIDATLGVACRRARSATSSPSARACCAARCCGSSIAAYKVRAAHESQSRPARDRQPRWPRPAAAARRDRRGGRPVPRNTQRLRRRACDELAERVARDRARVIDATAARAGTRARGHRRRRTRRRRSSASASYSTQAQFALAVAVRRRDGRGRASERARADRGARCRSPCSPRPAEAAPQARAGSRPTLGAADSRSAPSRSRAAGAGGRRGQAAQQLRGVPADRGADPGAAARRRCAGSATCGSSRPRRCGRDDGRRADAAAHGRGPRSHRRLPATAGRLSATTPATRCGALPAGARLREPRASRRRRWPRSTSW